MLRPFSIIPHSCTVRQPQWALTLSFAEGTPPRSFSKLTYDCADRYVQGVQEGKPSLDLFRQCALGLYGEENIEFKHSLPKSQF